MKLHHGERSLWRYMAAVCAAGMVFGSSCSSDQIRALTAGLEAVADTLNEQDDNMSFGDWLLDELEDL